MERGGAAPALPATPATSPPRRELPQAGGRALALSGIMLICPPNAPSFQPVSGAERLQRELHRTCSAQPHWQPCTLAESHSTSEAAACYAATGSAVAYTMTRCEPAEGCQRQQRRLLLTPPLGDQPADLVDHLRDRARAERQEHRCDLGPLGAIPTRTLQDMGFTNVRASRHGRRPVGQPRSTQFTETVALLWDHLVDCVLCHYQCEDNRDLARQIGGTAEATEHLEALTWRR
ncbi:MAG: hypothetical protein RLZZ387_2770 [Chloroflexota bacterium]|jgi:hypothetical protein